LKSLNKLNDKLKGFTLAEMLVTLALTGLLAMFAYKGMGYVQRMFFEYTNESTFISTVNNLNDRIQKIAGRDAILVENNQRFSHLNDSLNEFLQIQEDYILIGHSGKVDTFKVKCNNVKISYSNLISEFNSIRPVQKLEWNVVYRSQTFAIALIKNYDAVTKFRYETSKLY